MQNKSTKTLRIIALSSLAAAILCAGGFTYAWYINNKTASTNGDVSVETSSSLQICDASAGGFTTFLTVTRKATYNFADLTSDGNTFYNPTSLGEDYTNPEDWSFQDVTHAREQTKGEYSYFLSLDLRIRSSANCDVYLSSDSYVKPKELSNMEKCESNPDSYSDDPESEDYYMRSEKFERPSAYGVFSQDGIAGAARVAFYSVENVPVVTEKNYQNYYVTSADSESGYKKVSDTDEYSASENYYRQLDDGTYKSVPNVFSDQTLNNNDCFYTDDIGLDHSAFITSNSGKSFDSNKDYFTKELTLLNVWIPNPQYQLSRGTTNTFSLNGDIEDDYGYAVRNNTTDKTEMSYYSQESYLDHSVTVGDDLAQNDDNTSLVNSSYPLCSFRDTDGTFDNTKAKELFIKIWFEGTDRESYPYLDGGQVDYKLAFVGLTPKTEQETIADSFSFDVGNKNISQMDTDGSYEYSTNGSQWVTYDENTTLGYGYDTTSERTYLYHVSSYLEDEDDSTSTKYFWKRDNMLMPFVDQSDNQPRLMFRKKETKAKKASDPVWVAIGNIADMPLPSDGASSD